MRWPIEDSVAAIAEFVFSRWDYLGAAQSLAAPIQLADRGASETQLCGRRSARMGGLGDLLSEQASVRARIFISGLVSLAVALLITFWRVILSLSILA